jgi:hypothetical protein
MLESVRTHQKLLQTILLILILPSFVFIGVQSYMGMGGSASDIAKVGNEAISSAELDNAVKGQAQRSGIPEALSNNPSFKNNVLNQLIQQRLLRYEMQSLGLQVSDQRLANELIKFPEIQALKKPDGSIDAEKYRLLLLNNGLSVSQFETIKKSEVMGADLQNAIASNQQGITSELLSNKVIDGFAVEREVQVMFFLSNQYAKKVKLEDKDIQDYFQAHPADFQTTPKVDVEYVVLKKDSKLDEKEFSKLADNFANVVYEQADSLQPAADSVHSKIQVQKGITSQGLSSLPKDHPLNQTKTLQAIFADEAIKSNKNTDAIQLPGGDLVAVHVTNYEASKTQDFADVKSRIIDIVTQKKAEEMAINDGTNFAQTLQKDPKAKFSGQDFSKSVWVSRLRPLDLKGEPFEKVFSAKADQLPQFVYANIPGAGLALYRINQVRNAEKSDPKVKIEQFKQIADMNLQNELAAYFANIRDRASVKVLRLPQ